MSSNSYHFTTRWRVQGTMSEVADIFGEPEAMMRWWPSVYLDVRVLEPGDEDGLGKVIALYTKGWLPYTLRWQFRVSEIDYPQRLGLTAWGDFNGRGLWRLTQDGDWVDVVYDWQVAADKPLLKYLSFIMKPIFAANHHWAMAQGEESLRLELLRRRGGETAVPPPPGPTFGWLLKRP